MPKAKRKIIPHLIFKMVLLLLISMAFLFSSANEASARQKDKDDEEAEEGEGVSFKDGMFHFGRAEIKFDELTNLIVESCKFNVMIAERLRSKNGLFVLTDEPMDCETAIFYYVNFLESYGVTYTQTGKYRVFRKDNDLGYLPSKIIINEFPAFNEKHPQYTLIYKVKHQDPEELRKVLEPMRSKNAKLYVFNDALVIMEFQSNIPKMVRLLDHLDVGSSGDKIFHWEAKHSPIQDIVNIAEQLFMKGGRDKKAAIGIEQMIVDERTNSMFIVGDEAVCKSVLAFVPKLDVSLDRVSEMDVVFLEFAQAEEVQSSLQTIVQGRGRRANTRQRKFGEDLEVKITADKQNNAIVLIGQPRGIQEIKRVIKKLDKFPKQVFLEVVVLEVSVTDTVREGLAANYAKKVDMGGDSYVMGGTSYGSLNSVALDPTSLMGLALGLRGPDVPGSAEAFGLGMAFPSFGVLLNALQTSSDVNVMANPFLMGLDNEEAEIIVGSNVPFITGASRDRWNQPVLSIQRQDIALTIKLKPFINEGRRVKLKIEVTIEDLLSMSEYLGPTTTKRAIKTTAFASEGSRVALGGILKDNEVKDANKVPVLGDIPIIGRLFRQETNSDQKTNLMIVIEPHILETPQDVKKIFKKKMEDRRRYIKELYGEEYDQYEIRQSMHDRVGLVEIIRSVVDEQKRQEALRNKANETMLITPETKAAEAEEAGRAVETYQLITPEGVQADPPEAPKKESAEAETEQEEVD